MPQFGTQPLASREARREARGPKRRDVVSTRRTLNQFLVTRLHGPGCRGSCVRILALTSSAMQTLTLYQRITQVRRGIPQLPCLPFVA